jgi:23S rRNA (guanosine2251-2'-O)-methyltransferase
VKFKPLGWFQISSFQSFHYAKSETLMKHTYVFGLHAASEMLQQHPADVLEMWVLQERQDARAGEVINLAGKLGIPIQRAQRNTLDKLVEGGAHQGVVLRCRLSAPLSDDDLEELLDRLAVPPLLLVLDGVQDPHNLGACLRTADAAGVHAVIIPRDRAAGLSAAVRKVACGAAETVPLIQAVNLARVLDKLKQRGVWLIGAAGDAKQTLFQAQLSGPLALVLGSEGEGMRRLTRESCDLLVKIPMAGAVESLNVSVAAGVCLYEAARQRMTA